MFFSREVGEGGEERRIWRAGTAGEPKKKKKN